MADFKTAAVFSDHMVLQRDKNIAVFGEGKDGIQIKVILRRESCGERERLNGSESCGETALSGQSNVCDYREAKTTVENGRFRAVLPSLPAGGPYEMTVTDGKDKTIFSDVMIGEVWLAGGQSNMEYELQNAESGPEAIANDREPNVRFYYTQKIAYMDEAFFAAEEKTGWEVFGAPGTVYWSAVGYFFARKLAAKLNVTVGVIGCNWGGTSASAWMDRESLVEDSELKSYVDEYEAAIEGKSVEQQIAEYDAYEAYHAAWGKKAEECAKIDPLMPWDEILRRCGECQWPGPMGCKNPFRPSGLYECMLMRVCPYTLRGVLWYQGESDDHKPRMYEKLFTKMIRRWRGYWDDPDMPFMIVQLPMHRYQQDPDFKNWPLIREAQMNVYRMVKNVGIAVITEFSQFHEIHPKWKLPVGERLCLQAMHHVYHCLDADDAYGPLYNSCRVHSDMPAEFRALLAKEPCSNRYGKSTPGIELSFLYADGGFCVTPKASDGIQIKDGCGQPDQTEKTVRPAGFEIAGADKEFVPANCLIAGDRMYVYAEEAAEPLYVRYAWTNYMEVNVFGKRTGIPLAPFRTCCHDEKEEKQLGQAKIQQVMEL